MWIDSRAFYSRCDVGFCLFDDLVGLKMADFSRNGFVCELPLILLLCSICVHKTLEQFTLAGHELHPPQSCETVPFIRKVPISIHSEILTKDDLQSTNILV